MHLEEAAAEPVPGAAGARREPCGARAGTCLWPPGQRVRAIVPRGVEAVRAVLWGDLEEFDVGDLLSMLQHQRRTGLLLVTRDDLERVLVFVEGEITWTRSEDPEEGDDPSEVVFGLLSGRTGTFSLLRVDAADLPAGTPNQTQALLLDGLRRLDESRR